MWKHIIKHRTTRWVRHRLCPAVMNYSSILDIYGCYSSHPSDDCFGFIKLETMLKGIHIFLQRGNLLPRWSMFSCLSPSKHTVTSKSDIITSKFYTITSKFKTIISRSDDDADGLGSTTFKKSTLLAASAFFCYFNQRMRWWIGQHKLGSRHCNLGWVS